MSWVVHIQGLSNGDLRIGTDLRKADPCVHEPAILSLAAHLGFHVETMHKAVEAVPDPRYPQVATLFQRMQRTWTKLGGTLVQRVVELVQRATPPFSAETERQLHTILDEHVVGVEGTFAGRSNDLRTLRRLLSRGDVPADDLISIVFRIGRGLPMLEPHSFPARMPELPRFDDVLEEAREVDLDETDDHALRYARRRAGMFMRAPAQAQTREVERLLSQHELTAVRGLVGDAVESRSSSRKLASDLREVVSSTKLTNDMERVAITELTLAHNYGGYRALKDQTAEVGEDDPEVYKIVSPRACDDCRRVWGAAGSKHYPMSLVEERDARGGNHGLPRSQWGPVIGPVHPRCTEGPLQLYTPQLADAIAATVDEMIELYGEDP